MPRRLTTARGPRVLVFDDDRDIAEVIQSVLVDEGYRVTCLYEPNADAVKAAVARTSPDCILLDGGGPVGYSTSWTTAAWIGSHRPTPVIMLTGHKPDADEAQTGTSARALAADFAAVLTKPFNIDDLAEAVARATKRGTAARAVAARTREMAAQMVKRLETANAREISSSSRRAWATFRGPQNELLQLYWWEKLGAYFLGRYSDDGRRLEPLGQFTELDAAIAFAFPGP